MSAPRTTALPTIEVRDFKWPRRAGAVTRTRLLGEDEFGRWLGVAAGDPWWRADGSCAGVFDGPLAKVVPDGTYWSACFYPADPLVDVDVILPVTWRGDVLEEVDLELDVLRYADGSVRVRDRDEFERVRAAWSMPEEVVTQAEATCERLRALVEARAEPFGEVGRAWLARFLAGVEARTG
jgi:uncharacterized protein